MRQDNGSVSTPPVRRRNRSLAPTTKPAAARSLIPVVSGVEANTCPVRSSSQASSAGEPGVLALAVCVTHDQWGFWSGGRITPFVAITRARARD